MLTGDHRADAERLFLKYGQGVASYVLARVRNYEAAEAITSRVFLIVVRKMSQCRGSAAAWLWSIVRSEIARYFRDRPNHARLEQDLPAGGEGPSEELARKEQQSRLISALSELSPEQQEVLSMKYFMGMRNKDIAAALGTTPTHIGVKVHRALKALRKRMSPSASDPMIGLGQGQT